MSANECLIPLCSCDNALSDLQIFKCNDVKYMMQDLQIYACKVPETEVVGIFETDEKIFVVDRSHCVKQFYWDSFPLSDNVPFQIRYERTRTPVLSAVPQASVYLEEVNKLHVVHKILDVFSDEDDDQVARDRDGAASDASVSSESLDAAVAASARQRNFMVRSCYLLCIGSYLSICMPTSLLVVSAASAASLRPLVKQLRAQDSLLWLLGKLCPD